MLVKTVLVFQAADKRVNVVSFKPHIVYHYHSMNIKYFLPYFIIYLKYSVLRLNFQLKKQEKFNFEDQNDQVPGVGTKSVPD